MELQDLYGRLFEKTNDPKYLAKINRHVMRGREYFRQFADTWESDPRSEVKKMEDESAKPYFLSKLHRARLSTKFVGVVRKTDKVVMMKNAIEEFNALKSWMNWDQLDRLKMGGERECVIEMSTLLPVQLEKILKE